MLGGKLIEHPNSYELVVDKSVNSNDDEKSCLEDAIIEDSFEWTHDEDVFSCGIDDGQSNLEEDVIADICEDKSKTNLSSNVQPNQLEEDLME